MGPQESKICAMLKSGDPELQCSAARVLGELKPKDPTVIRALGSVLEDGLESVRLYALGALRNIGSKSALRYVIPRLSADEIERRAAASAVAAVGNAALPDLKRELPGLTPAGRQAAADIIMSIGTEAAFDVLLDALALGDFDLCRHISDLFRDRIATFSKARQDAIFRKVVRFLGQKDVLASEVATIAGLRIMGYLKHDKSLDMLVPYLSDDKPPAIRRHALLAVSALLPVRRPKPEFVDALLRLLSDRTHPDIMESSLRILNGITIPASLSDEMIKLLYNRHSAVRKLSVRALESFGTIKATRALLECLNRADWELTSDTMSALRKIKHTPEVIFAEVEKTEDRERARRLANVLRGGKFDVPATILNGLGKKLLTAIEEDSDKLDIYFALMSSLSDEHLISTLVSRADDLKKAGRYQEAERHLRMLTQLGPPPPEVKFQLGVVRLKLSKKTLAAVDRAADPALALIASLIRVPDFDLLKRLQGEHTVLGPHDYLYVGYHFRGSEGVEKEFGTKVLKYLISIAPKSNEAKKARERLKG